MAVDLTRAMQLAIDLDTIIRAGIPSRYEDRSGYEAGYVMLLQTIGAADPKGNLREDWQGAVLRACGLRATSTSGIHGAVTNWIRQVEQKSGLPLRRHPSTNIGE